MADIDAQSLVDQAVLIGLLTGEQARVGINDAEDGSLEALARSLMRKQFLTSWQFEKLKKGETGGFFFGDCVVLFHLAEGTFARVYRGRKQSVGQPVAVKVLRQRFVTDPASIERFNKEAEAGLKLAHPNIVRIYDYGEQERRYYMTMEYVEGSNLRDFLKFRQRLNPAEALPLMLGLARGLQYSLSKGVTHRDLKPSNILIASNGVAKLVDFGLATIEGDDKKGSNQSQRTVDYSNLERTCLSPKGDPRSDIFFMGCVFYQMLTGQNPMPEADSKDLLVKMLKRSINAIKPISEHHHAPPEGMSRIIETMMQVNLKARYQTMEEVVEDLESYQASAAGQTSKPVVLKAVAAREAGPEFDVEAEFMARGRDGTAARAHDVLCIEAQGSIREALGKALTGMGYRVELAGDAEAAALKIKAAAPDALIFDADGFGATALTDFLQLRKRARKDGRDPASLVLTSPKHAEMSELITDGDRLKVLSKPLKMKEIQEAIRQLLPIG